MSTDFAANSSQLVRYHLQLPESIEEQGLISIRSLLTEHHFLVDQLGPGEAVVASTQGADPDWGPVKAAMKALGHPILAVTTAE